MKIIRKNQAKKFKNSDVCTAYEYPLNEREIDGAVVKIDGRYPSKGRVTNEKCKEVCYIIEGSGKIVIEDKEIIIDKGDLVLIEAGEKYYWDGDLTMFVSCTPAWYPEQHKEVI